jgi:hypothetical protein
MKVFNYFFLYLHRPNKGLETISMFLFSPPQLSSQKSIFRYKKYLGSFPPLQQPLPSSLQTYASGGTYRSH